MMLSSSRQPRGDSLPSIQRKSVNSGSLVRNSSQGNAFAKKSNKTGVPKYEEYDANSLISKLKDMSSSDPNHVENMIKNGGYKGGVKGIHFNTMAKHTMTKKAPLFNSKKLGVTRDPLLKPV